MTFARTGTVLISRPTIESAPANSAGRPETAVPKATSCWPVSAHQQLRPRGLQHGADGGVAGARQLAEGPGGLGRRPERFDASRPTCRVRRAHQGGGVEAVEHLAPRRLRGVDDPDRPASVTNRAVRRGRGQPLPEIAGEDLLQQDRQRPAIDHDVVIGQHEPVPVAPRCGSTPPGRPAGRRGRRPRRVRRRTAARSARRHRSSPRSSTIPPRHHRIGGDDLHRLVELVGRIGPPGWDGGRPRCAPRRAAGPGRAAPVTVMSSCTAYTSSPEPCGEAWRGTAGPAAAGSAAARRRSVLLLQARRSAAGSAAPAR